MSDLSGWGGCARPPKASLVGRWVRLEPLDPARHADALWSAHVGTDVAATYRYMPYGPFDDRASYGAHLAKQAADPSDLYFALVTAERGAAGVASLMSIEPAHGVAEVGHICLAPSIRRTPAATEMVALIGQLLFDRLGYRRFEWKCDNANKASKAAARRFGFREEGVFRHHRVVKQRNRDTAWFSMVRDEWPERRAAFERWLAPENFDHDGQQKMRLNGPLRAMR